MTDQETAMTVAQDVDLQALIAQAIDKGTAVETMERLFALAREWKAMAARDAYFRALAKFQAACPVIKKEREVRDRTGKLRYRYAPLDEIVRQIGGLLAEHGFSYTIDTEQTDGKLVAFCDAHHVGGHSERTRLEVPVGSEYMTAQQMIGAARTYAMRYVFCNAFGILTGDEDNDATTTEDGAMGDAPEDRPAQPMCPKCGKPLRTAANGDLYCWRKKGGCGANWTPEEWEQGRRAQNLPSAEAQADILDAQNTPIESPEEVARRVFRGEKPATMRTSMMPSKRDETEARSLFS